jgi:hypothetical protein
MKPEFYQHVPVYYYSSVILEENLGTFDSVVDFTKMKTQKFGEYYYKVREFGISEVFAPGTQGSSNWTDIICKLLSSRLELRAKKLSTGRLMKQIIRNSPLHAPSMGLDFYVKHLSTTSQICRPYIVVELYKDSPVPFPQQFEHSEIIEKNFYTTAGENRVSIELKSDSNYIPYLRSLSLYGGRHDYKHQILVSLNLTGPHIYHFSYPIHKLRVLSERQHHFLPIRVDSHLNLLIEDEGSGGTDLTMQFEIAYATPKEVLL